MFRAPSPSSLLRSVVAALLLLAMLAGQWTGLEHRIRHAGRDVPHAHAVAVAADHGDEGYAHSCQLFDAAALGLGIHSAFAGVTCGNAVQDWRQAWSPHAWHPLFIAYFPSRAPPFD